MTIRAVNSSQDNKTLSTVVTTSAVGAGLGYAAKYIVPLTKEEKQTPAYRKATSIINRESSRFKSEVIDEIRKTPKKSLAQDTFIKMVDSKEKIDTKNVRAKIAKLGGEESLDGIEFKNIISYVNETGSNLVKKCRQGYDWTVKSMRPAAPLIAAGALTGLFVGIVHNATRTNTSS